MSQKQASLLRRVFNYERKKVLQNIESVILQMSNFVDALPSRRDLLDGRSDGDRFMCRAASPEHDPEAALEGVPDLLEDVDKLFPEVLVEEGVEERVEAGAIFLKRFFLRR